MTTDMSKAKFESKMIGELTHGGHAQSGDENGLEVESEHFKG